MRHSLLAALGFLCLTTPVFAVRGIPVGTPLVVSHTGYSFFSSDGLVLDARVATSASGEFVVVWAASSENTNGYSYNIMGRRYDASFAPRGGEFPIASYDGGLYWDTMRPRVTMGPGGDFTAVWTQPEDEGPIFARRYDAAGVPQGPPVQLGSTDYYGRYTTLVPEPGGYALAWEQYTPGSNMNVFVRRFDADLAPLGPRMQANTIDGGWEGYVDAASDAAGNFVVVWNTAYNTDDGVFGRRYDANGVALGGQFQVMPYDDDEGSPVVAAAPDGSFVVASAIGTSVQVRRYDAGGAPLGDPFVAAPSGGNPAITMAPDGTFAVIYHHWTPDEHVYGTLFDANGVADGPAFKVSTSPIDDDYLIDHPSVAPLPNGDFVVAWAHSYYGDYAATRGVYVRRVATCGDGRESPGLPCDDANLAPLDGCSASCQVEACHTCAGAPSVCDPIPACGAVCTDAAAIDPKVILTLGRLGSPAGDETVSFTGSIVSPPVAPGAYDPLVEGAEVVITGADVIWGLMDPTPVPPGGLGTGCGPFDGWKASGRAPSRSYTYKNLTGALPPGCAPGSARGLRTLKIQDRIATRGVIKVQLKAKTTTLPPIPAAPLVATIVLGRSPAAGSAGRCAAVTLGHWTNSGRTARYVP